MKVIVDLFLDNDNPQFFSSELGMLIKHHFEMSRKFQLVAYKNYSKEHELQTEKI